MANNELLNTLQEKVSQPILELDELLLKSFQSIIGNNITLVFTLVILVIFLIVLFYPKSNLGKHFSPSATSILPTIGVLGTFVGVFIALQNFNFDNIDSSMSLIVEGLKVAFITSIFGLSTGIIIKLVQSSKSNAETGEGVGAEEILTELQFSRKETAEQNKKIINAISGDADSSLNTQIKLMRTDLNDFAKTVAEANTTAFIDALKEAISDFNKNLTDQFGENFKKLNDAIGKLLEWQQNNKNDMEHMRSSINTAIEGISTAENSLTKIKESAEAIPNTVESLSDILMAIQSQVRDVEGYLQTFADVSNQAKDAMPRIEEVLNNYTDGLEKTSNEIIENLNENLQAQKGIYSELQTNFSTVFEDFGTLGNNLKDNILDVANMLSNKTSEILDNFSDIAEKSINNISDKLNNTSESILSNLDQVIIEQNNKSNNLIEKFSESSNAIITNFNTSSSEAINQMSVSSKEVVNNATSVILEHSDATKKIASELSNQVNIIGASLSDQLQLSINKISNSFENSLQETQESQKTQISSFTKELTTEYENSTSRLQSITEELLNETKTSVEKVLNEELQGFSNRLGSIAERMADQFGKLTDAFQKAIQAAEKLDKK